MELLRGFGCLFYLVDPRDLTADRLEDAPNFTAQAIPYVFILGVIEAGKDSLQWSCFLIFSVSDVFDS